MLTTKEIAVIELKQKGLKQIEIAKKLKISQPAVSNFYNKGMKKIAEAKEILNIAKKLEVKL